MSDTAPTNISPDTQPRKAKKNRLVPILIGALVLLVALALGGAAGYTQGIGARVSIQQTNVSKVLVDQFGLAQQDVEAKRYDVARQRLEYILQKDQNYPGAVDMLTKLLVQMAITPSATPTLVPSATPTPDLRSQDAIFTQAQEQIKNSDWSNALASLDSLRKADPTYKSAQVDGMYYTGLRNRGIDEILGQRAYAQTTNLEGGIYDLTLAERFGPLDGLADGMRNWARLYILGASFWELDWGQAMNYFEQVAAYAPNLRDASNMTASQRYYQSLLKYGDTQAGLPKLHDRCQALDYWGKANAMTPLNDEYAYKFAKLTQECTPPTNTPEPAEPTPEG